MIVVDASALVAILLGEEDGPLFRETLIRATTILARERAGANRADPGPSGPAMEPGSGWTPANCGSSGACCALS